MKKTILTVLFFAAALVGMAQKSVDNQIQQIRTLYNNVCEQIKQGYSTENPIGTAVIDHIATYSAVGYKKGKIEVYTYLYDVDDTEDDRFDEEQFNTQQVVMIRENYERGVWQHYREFLYDTETGEPVFCYFRYMNPDTYEQVEQRFYFSKGKMLKAAPSATASKASEALKIAKAMRVFGRSVFEETSLDFE